MSAFLQDLRYAARRLVRTPVFSSFSVAILTIGIGLNIAVFSVVDALVLRPAPFAQSERLVHVYQDSDSGSPSSTAYPAYRDMAAMTDVFSSVAATTSTTANWDTPDGPREVAIDFATASYFPTLGLKPLRGRWFDAAHDNVGAEMVAVVTYHAWSTRFGADPSIVGRTIRLNNQPVTIIGVGPRGFNGEAGLVNMDLWASISSVGIGGQFRVANLGRREDHWYNVKARLAPGVGPEQAQAALGRLAARYAAEFPDQDRGRDITLFTWKQVRMHPNADAALLGGGMGLFTVAAVVLLLACSNLANLLLVRGIARAPELAIRGALGGDRARIARPLVLEALLLSSIGGAAGLGLAVWLQGIVAAVPLPPLNAGLDLRFDLRMVTFTVLAALGTGLLFGFLPSRRAARAGVAAALRDAGRTHSGNRSASLLRGTLVAVQVALSAVLVVATALLARSFVNTGRVDPGVDAGRIAVIGTLPLQAGVTTGEGLVAIDEQILERMRTVPGVESAALTTRLPLTGGGFTTSTVIPGYEPATGTDAVEMPLTIVSRGYFATMGIALRAGRAFADTDRLTSPQVVVLNETAARTYFGGDAVGRRVRAQADADSWKEVVGVVADTKIVSLEERPTPMMYYSSDQVPAGGFSVVVRTNGDPAALLGVLPGALREVRESLPVTRLEPFAAHVAGALASARTSALLMGAFAALALLLAGLGIYAAVSFAVERRTHEIGIRVALGATATRLIRMVVGESLLVAGVGIAAGLGLAVLAAFGMRSLLFGVAPVDGVSFGAAAAVLAAAAGLAAFLPARRAAAANPSDVLRDQ
ncbi:MAG TPA: ABC transporter permease [Gammaproteobacteria bacterium]|nr:ABC transporter permease [Gammaproteobacteria bacterium]